MAVTRLSAIVMGATRQGAAVRSIDVFLRQDAREAGRVARQRVRIGTRKNDNGGGLYDLRHR